MPDGQAAAAPVLVARDLVKRYQRRTVVDRLSFDVRAGEVVGLLGRNGAGKTTSFRMAVGLVRPDAGAVLLRDADITHLPMYRRARLGLGYLPQEPSIFRRMTVEENLLAVLEAQDLARAAQRERAEALCTELGLQKVRASKAETLSGGERRRLEIARALALTPVVLLLDEPFAGVDPIAVADIQALVRDLRGRGIGILLTDHNVRETLAITDRSYIIDQGRCIAEGPPKAIVEHPEVRRTYLGEGFTAPELAR